MKPGWYWYRTSRHPHATWEMAFIKDAEVWFPETGVWDMVEEMRGEFREIRRPGHDEEC